VTDEPRLQQVLDELFASDSTPEEVCRSCPDLLPAVLERWRQARRVLADLDVLFPPLAQPCPRPPVGAELPTIPGYQVEAVLGRGGMGVVYRARNLRLNRPVALKMLLAGAYAAPHERERFEREAELLAGLRHPNIVQVYDAGEVDGRLYFTMELVEGGGLAKRLAGTPQPARQAAALVAVLAAAVQAAHRAGIVHRDLKPSNVLIDPAGVPRISDFGLARRVDGAAGLTQTGAFVGTPSYVAPEQARGKPDAVGFAADVYALGAILYELVTGRPPFRAETAAETVVQVIHQDPVPPARLNAKVPRDLETVCLKCLHKEPRRRYGSAGALAEDLGRFLDGRPILARPTSRLERGWRWCRRNPRESALAGLALLVLLLIAGGAWWADRQRTKRQAEQLRQEERTRQGVRGALEQARGLRRQARWPEAKEALAQAALLIGEDGPEELHRQLESARRDLQVAQTLDDVAQEKALITDGQVAPTRAARDYERAFRNYGLAVRDEGVSEVAERIRGSDLQQELLNALDDWIFLEPSDLAGKLAAVASAADPAPWRAQVRRAVAERNLLALPLLAATAPRAERSVPLLLGLARRFVWTREERLAVAAGGASDLGLLAAGGGGILGAVALVCSRDSSVGRLLRLQQEHPDDFWVNFELGNALGANDQAEAIRYYQAALAVRRSSVVVHRNLGAILVHDGRPGEAVGYFRRAIHLAPPSAQARNNLGSALALDGQLDEAIAQFRKVLRLDPENVRAHYHLGLAFESKGRAEALEHFRKALEIDPRFAAAQSSLLSSLRRLGRLDDAIEHFRRTIRTYPRDANAHNHLGAALVGTGRTDEAIRHFRKALQINPEDASTHTNLSFAMFRKRRIDEALAHLRRAVAINPKYTDAQKGLRTILLLLGRPDEARAAWEAALRANPPEHSAWYGYAEFCLFLGQEDEYRQARHALLRRFSATTDPQLAERTGRACLLLPASGEQLRQAVALAGRAAAADRSRYPGIYAHFLFVRGLAEYRQGRFDRAITTMRGEASRVRGPAPRLVLALALHRSGQQEQARKTLAAAVGAYDWRAELAHDQDAWICHALRREAQRLIRAK
jgi:serine/threonine-protein kinase